jgi:hypothetical protein
MENKIINDFRPETASLLNRILAAGWKIISTDDGSDEDSTIQFSTVEVAVEHLTSVDDSYVRIEPPNGKRCKRYTLALIYGNSPGELVSDYSFPHSGDEFEPILKLHETEWEGKKQPTTTLFERYPNLKEYTSNIEKFIPEGPWC